MNRRMNRRILKLKNMTCVLPFLFMLINFASGCNRPVTAETEIAKPCISIPQTRSRAAEAFLYCREKNFNTRFCILIDMSLHSGVNRFMVWDFTQDTFTHAFPVGHGCCDNPWKSDASKDNPRFSNQDGSHCSSLGKYKIGERAYSDWGVHVKYVLHGLEPTNSNALKRFIVFHSWEAVPDDDVYPDGTPEGWGCPTLSDKNFLLVDNLLKENTKPVLMWIYR